MGPGDSCHLTQEATDEIRNAHVVIGYDLYLKFISHLIEDKKVISSNMKQEVSRCKEAINIANKGKNVAVISGGDSGIYGMAGLILELASEYGMKIKNDKNTYLNEDYNDNKNYDIEIKIIPGIPAFVAAASLLGAPIMHDFSSISLSDLMTPWETIENRLKNAAQADFIIILYNPKSIKRDWQLYKAMEIISNYRDESTPVGVVKKAMRSGEEIMVIPLKDVKNIEIDMQTVIIVGNSQSYVYNGYLITPRGYKNKYEYK